MDAEQLAALAPGHRIETAGRRYTLKERQRRVTPGWELETSDTTYGPLWVADADLMSEFAAVPPSGSPAETGEPNDV